MNKTRVIHGFAFVSVLLATCVFARPAEAAEVSGKKLRIFLLAGQSNMTGYCGIMPLTNLANYRELEDPALRALDERLRKVVFPGEDAIRRNNERRARIYKLRVAIQDLTAQLNKAKQDKDATSIERLEKELKEANAGCGQLEAELEVAKGRRVYIAPDGRYGHKPGVLRSQQIWPLWPKWKEHYPEWHMVGSHVACHYLGSGRFFVRHGDALSTAMAGLMKQ